MTTTYDVRIWKTGVYKGKQVTTYYVRWTVDGKQFKEAYRNKAQAESFRADLVAAARRGEAFYVATGLPVSMDRADGRMAWYAFACAYTDMKWPRIAATTRRTHAEALTAVTALLFTDDRGRPDDRLLRTALRRWAFNTARRDHPDCPDDVRAALQWASGHTRPVAALSDAAVLRMVLDGLAVCLDGTPRAPSVVMRWRKILHNAVEYAVELKLLAVNPIPALRWKAPRTVQAVDRRAVVNPVQARALFAAAAGVKPTGPRLVAFYGCLYFAGLRPEEASALAKHNLSLPAEGWGQLHLERATPHAGREWTDSGDARDDRQLKQRPVGEVRPVPCPPELTALLHAHLAAYGTNSAGRLFVHERTGNPISSITSTRVWDRARRAAFTDDVVASPLAKTPYDLRHAAVSTWLNAGVPPTTVAEWAGHSVEILLKIYAKCIDGEDARMRARIDDALGRAPDGAGDSDGSGHDSA